jgi:hypothetical protein
MRLNGCPVEPGVLPQPLRNHHRVYASGPPPIGLIAVPVNGSMVGPTERHREFIADPTPHGSRLHEPQMVSVGRLPSAEKAWLRRHELQMGAIAVAPRFAQRQRSLIDMPGNCVVHRRDVGLRLHSGTSTASWTQKTSGATASGTLTVKEGSTRRAPIAASMPLPGTIWQILPPLRTSRSWQT